ncbi:PAS domain-containing protein [uncultured Nostoc sp.]|uniref:PAS domain-containing protein n=1 Tax=uncultured Nostoc sp. TaxID=340711 RepID=UPI0035CB1A87
MIALAGVTIQSKIYESSNSLVYRGIRVLDGRAIAVKMLKQDYPSPQELTRYRQEYEITRSLNIEGVVKAYSQQDYQRTLVILLEDFGGESLEQWMHKRPDFCPMPLSMFLGLAIALTDILGRLHAANVIHKDINPGNIVLNLNTGVVKIIDFGIATQFNRTNPTFKSPHQLEGTLAYLSPEQTGRMNRLLDYRTDFYSLGVTFYELLTGQLPFPTTDVLELVHCHIAKHPLPPHEMNTAIPRAVSEIILKLMAKNAEDRYQSAWGIKADLEVCAQQLETIGRIDYIQPGLQDVCDRFYIPQKLYGREAEVAVLLAAFERVAGREDARTRGRSNAGMVSLSPSLRLPVFASSEMMLVSGYAGIGKSALVQELYRPIAAKRGYFTWGKFDQFQRNIPYSALVIALRKLMQQLLTEPDKQLQLWRSRLLAALGSNGQLIIDAISEVELLIGRQQSVPEVEATEAQNRFNFIFQKFIRVFCSQSQPLVIFLDDLQWIDSATLKLIELMLLDEQTQHLFLIGAYRDNEVNPDHPLVLKLEELRQKGAVLQEIALKPLTLLPLSQLIAETLHHNTDTVLPLAELVLHKTEGNPFFVSEFLKTLYAEDCLTFDFERRSWQWNMAQIEAQNITDNVVDMLLLKLRKLPASTQDMLRLAACVGAEFDLETLSTVCKQPANTVFQALLTAIQDGFIQPLSELDENLLVQEYKFLHDRVQQAAYALIDQSQKQVVHLQIGRNLIEKSLPEQLSERLFEIVDHLNQGIELVTEQAERNEIAKLNLLASQKAKAAIAYSAAKKYLDTGRAWLAASSWQTNYELTLELYSQTTEVAYLCGEFEQVEHFAAIVLREAKTVLNRVKVYEVKIQTAIAQNLLLKAINTALQVLQQLGISFPEQPSQIDIQVELDTIMSLIGNKPIKDLIYLPQMTQPDKLAAMQILSKITLAARNAASDLVPLLALKQVNLSIQYGNSFVSPFAYASYGFALCGIFDNIETGYQFGQLALKLLSQPNTDALKAKTLLTVNHFIIHWKEHIRETLQPLLEGYQSGLETGDLEFAAYCAHIYYANSYFTGKELMEVEREITIYAEVIRQIKQEAVLTWSRIHHQTIANLMGCSTNPYRLVGEFYNQENELPQHKAANDVTAIFLVYFYKLFLCYLFSRYDRAVEYSVIAEPYVSRVASAYLVLLHYFYDALARLATYPRSSAQVQSEILKNVAVSQEEIKQWADRAPMNWLHKYHLVQAEMARVLGQLFEAEEFYEQAIQGARENGYIQEEALAYELAAKFYLARGREKFAQTYMKEAHYCYERWGATAKVKDLETRYPQFFPQPSDAAHTPIRTTSGTTSSSLPTQNYQVEAGKGAGEQGSRGESYTNSFPSALDLCPSANRDAKFPWQTTSCSDITFDLAAVMKASQAISSQIELDQLLSSLMQILIENAGAQTGFLILENSGEWMIEASSELNLGETDCATQVLQSIPIANHLPESIIQYVIRTHESVILNNATREGNFIHEPYIQHNQTQSIFCLPLLNQSQLVGVLYLENRLATGVFTPKRLQVLHLLSTQAAIAIENARLYSKLRTSESKMKQILEAVPVGIGVLNAAGRVCYVNQQGIQLLGKGIDPNVAPAQFPEVYQLYLAGTDRNYPSENMPIVRALNGERTTVDDLEIHQNGAIIPVEAWGTPIFDEQGNVIYAIAAFQDITERKQAERLLADYNHTLEQQVAERTTALQKSEAVLLDVYDELRLREQELRLITDSLPALISYVDANQRYRFVNRTYEVWFDRSRDEILGMHSRELLGEAVYQVAEPYIKQALAGQIKTYEVEVPYPSGKKHVSVTYIPDFDCNAQVRGYYTLVTDISDRKRAEEALQASEREIRALLAAIPDPFFVLTAEGQVIKAAEIEPTKLYKPIENQQNKTLHEIFAQKQADEFLDYIHQVLRTQQMLTVEYYLWMAGRKTWFSTRIVPIQHDQVIWLARDITAHKQAEAASILEERNRMAREIHDTLAQAFTGILVHMGAISRLATTNPEAVQTHTNTVRELARSGLTEARRSVAALRPQLLEDGNLWTALEQFVSTMQSSTEINLLCNIVGTPYTLPPETENNLLKIAQEAFTNAIKYAHASEIRIELTYGSMLCSLRVIDNGQGFEINNTMLNRGFGLLSITERAEQIKAQLSIESQPGQGTEVVISVNREIAA